MVQRNLVQTAINTLNNNGMLYEAEGATWLKSTKFGDDKDKYKADALQYSSDYTKAVADLDIAKASGAERVKHAEEGLAAAAASVPAAVPAALSVPAPAAVPVAVSVSLPAISSPPRLMRNARAKSSLPVFWDFCRENLSISRRISPLPPISMSFPRAYSRDVVFIIHRPQVYMFSRPIRMCSVLPICRLY